MKRANRFTNRHVLIDGLKTDNGYLDCPYCENTFHYYDGEIDHIVPASMGGSNARYNLVLVCRECNQLKQNTPLHIFLYTNGHTPETAYMRLKQAEKSIPESMLIYLGRDD